MAKRKYTPSETELKEAKDFLLERLDAERMMSAAVKKIFERAVERIVIISYKYNIDPQNFSFSKNKNLQKEVDDIIDGLKIEIYEDVNFIAAYQAEEKKDDIYAFINRENHGKDLWQRLEEYADKFKVEIGLGILAALYLGEVQDMAISAIKAHLLMPFQNPYIKKAIKKGAPIIIPNYGQGHTNSMLNAVLKLTNFAVAEGWMHRYLLEGIENGAIGFVTFRNSTYPCDICDEYAYWVHPLDDPMPPLHLNCVCGAVFVYP